MFKKKLIKTFLVVFLGLSPCVSLANEYKYLSVSFLGKEIGTIKVREINSADSREIHINGKIFSSPFKVFNGQFNYKTIITKLNNAASTVHYSSSVNATFKHREINYLVKDDHLIAVDIFPEKEGTKFTNPKQIDFEFIDPAYAITQLLTTPCKNSFKIYDGRRIIEVTSIQAASQLKCRYLYKIQKGPGHLRPFNFKTIEISTFFNQDGNSESRSMAVKTGPFKIILNKLY